MFEAKYMLLLLLLWSGLVQLVGASHRVSITTLHSISEKVLSTKDVPIMFDDVWFISRKHGLAFVRI